MKKKVVKVIATVSIVMLTLVITVVPCFAIGNGHASSVGGDTVEFMPSYVETVHYFQYAFTNNSIVGSSSGSFITDSGDSFTFNTSSDSNYSAVTLYDNSGIGYDGTIAVITNEFVFKRGSLSNDSYPTIVVDAGGYAVPLGNARCVYYTTVNSGDTVTSYTDTVYVSFVEDIIDGGLTFTLGSETYNVINSHSSLPTDVVEMRVEVYWDATYDPDAPFGKVAECFIDYRDTEFVDSYLSVNVTENVDVLSWLPNTIDSFFNVSLFGDVTIGNIFLLVLAIPALIAVLRMLGGVG